MIRAAIVLGVLWLSTDVRAWCQLRTRTGEVTRAGECATEGVPLAWQDRCVSYSVNSAESLDLDLETVRRISAASFANWTTQVCEGDAPFPLQIQEDSPRACTLAQHLTDGPNVHTLTFIEDWPEDFEENVYAITSVWHRASDGAILDADMLVNETNGPFGECPAGGCRPDEGGVTTVDLESVLTHEIGHFFGLAHSQFAFATMHASAPRGETDKRTVSSDDILGVCGIYPLDGPAAACDFVPIGGLARFCEPQAGCSLRPASKENATSGGLMAFLVLVVLRRTNRRSTRRRRTR
ncbi:MAG: hypothetical protein ACI9KE_000182 [Polyangiales bacterium]|jgi:hypothetical protein